MSTQEELKNLEETLWLLIKLFSDKIRLERAKPIDNISPAFFQLGIIKLEHPGYQSSTPYHYVLTDLGEAYLRAFVKRFTFMKE